MDNIISQLANRSDWILNSDESVYYGFADGVHTFQTRVTSLVATVKIQGTLATDPASTDWVDLSSVITSDGSTASTNSYLTNLTGNYTWVRIAVSEFTAGTINSVYLAH